MDPTHADVLFSSELKRHEKPTTESPFLLRERIIPTLALHASASCASIVSQSHVAHVHPGRHGLAAGGAMRHLRRASSTSAQMAARHGSMRLEVKEADDARRLTANGRLGSLWRADRQASVGERHHGGRRHVGGWLDSWMKSAVVVPPQSPIRLPAMPRLKSKIIGVLLGFGVYVQHQALQRGLDDGPEGRPRQGFARSA